MQAPLVVVREPRKAVLPNFRTARNFIRSDRKSGKLVADDGTDDKVIECGDRIGFGP